MKFIIASVFLCAFLSTGFAWPWGNRNTPLNFESFESSRTELFNKLVKIESGLRNVNKQQEANNVRNYVNNLNGLELRNNLKAAVEFVSTYEKYHSQQKSNGNSVMEKFDQLLNLLQKVQAGLNRDGEVSESVQAEIHTNNVLYQVKPVFENSLELVKRYGSNSQNYLYFNIEFPKFMSNIGKVMYITFADELFGFLDKVEAGVQEESDLSDAVKQQVHDESESLKERLNSLRIQRILIQAFNFIHEYENYAGGIDFPELNDDDDQLLQGANHIVEQLKLIASGLRKDNLVEEAKKVENVYNGTVNEFMPLLKEVSDFTLPYRKYFEESSF